MEDDTQVVPLDLTINTGVLRQNDEEIIDVTGLDSETIAEQEIVPPSEPSFAHNINDLATSSSYAAVQPERQLVLYENTNQVKNPEELNSTDGSDTAKLVLGSPDCSSCNNTRYFESIIASIEKKIDGLKKSMKDKEDAVVSTPGPSAVSFGPTLYGSQEMQERLFQQYQASSYAKPPESYKNYYTKETRRSETIKIYGLGNVEDKQVLVENVSQNLNEIKVETHSDIHIVSTINQDSLQTQYLVPQLQPTPIVLEQPSKYVPIAPRNETWVTSTNVELNAYVLNTNTMLQSHTNSGNAASNALPEEPNYWQPIRSGFTPEELNELLTEIHNIEAYVTTMDRDGNREAYSVERFCPEYWAFLTNKLIKIRNQQYMLNGFNDTYCDKILSRVHALGKFPQEYWCPVYRPSTGEGCSRYLPQEEVKPKIVLKLSRNLKECRRYTRGGRGRPRRKNPESSWSVMQTQTSAQSQSVVQTTEVSTGNHEGTATKVGLPPRK